MQRPKAPDSEEGRSRIPKRDNWEWMPLDAQLHSLPVRPRVHHLLLRGRASHPRLGLHGGAHRYQDQGQHQQALPMPGVFWSYPFLSWKVVTIRIVTEIAINPIRESRVMGITLDIGSRTVPDQPSAFPASLMAPLTLSILLKAGRYLVLFSIVVENVESSSSSSCLHLCLLKVCVEDIECLLDPPSVPSHPEYAVITQGPPGQQK